MHCPMLLIGSELHVPEMHSLSCMQDLPLGLAGTHNLSQEIENRTSASLPEQR